MSSSAQNRTLTVLHTFTGGTDGANPRSELIRDSAGNLYGTTSGGGMFAAPCPNNGCGTVFKIDSSGNETVLYRFTGGVDGIDPLGGVIRDAAGNLYGTASGGGASGFGTVFKLDKNGNETTLYSFTGPVPSDGEGPNGSLVRDAAGNLYGTTVAGGNGCVQGFDSSCGTVFKVDTSGKETVLYTFQATTDGAMPFSGLVMDAAGNLYGTASNGGHLDPNSLLCDVFGCGTVFKIDTTGTYSVLYTFLGGKDGDFPEAPVILDAAGNLYGTTYRDLESPTNCLFGCGVLFKVNAGKETVLYHFVGGSKAASPGTAKLLRGVGGVIWGTTSTGGASGDGVVYRVDPGGKETDLHSFTGGADGAHPAGGVIRDLAGNFYGATYDGGDLTCGNGHGCGTIYKITAVAP